MLVASRLIAPIKDRGFARVPQQVVQLAMVMLGLHLILVILLLIFLPPVQPFIQRFEPNQTVQLEGGAKSGASLYLNTVKLFTYPEWALDLTFILGLILTLVMLFRGRRWRGAMVGLGILSFGLAVLYLPILPMLYIPIVLRLRFSWQVTAWLCFVLALMFIGLWSAYFLSLNQAFLTLLLGFRQLGFLLGGLFVSMLIFTAYMLVIFEIALRQAQARDQLEITERELRRLGVIEANNALLEERNRITGELHDSLGHHLTAQRYDLQTAQKQLELGMPITTLSHALQRNSDAISAVRHIISASRPEIPFLYQAVRQLVQSWSQPELLRLELNGAEPRLSLEQQHLLYHAVQELITNANKHAPNEILYIRIQSSSSACEIQTSNLAHSPAKTNGFGLRTLEQRLLAFGGTLRLEQSKEFRVWIHLPLQSD